MTSFSDKDGLFFSTGLQLCCCGFFMLRVSFAFLYFYFLLFPITLWRRLDL